MWFSLLPSLPPLLCSPCTILALVRATGLVVQEMEVEFHPFLMALELPGLRAAPKG